LPAWGVRPRTDRRQDLGRRQGPGGPADPSGDRQEDPHSSSGQPGVDRLTHRYLPRRRAAALKPWRAKVPGWAPAIDPAGEAMPTGPICGEDAVLAKTSMRMIGETQGQNHSRPSAALRVGGEQGAEVLVRVQIGGSESVQRKNQEPKQGRRRVECSTSIPVGDGPNVQVRALCG